MSGALGAGIAIDGADHPIATPAASKELYVRDVSVLGRSRASTDTMPVRLSESVGAGGGLLPLSRLAAVRGGRKFYLAPAYDGGVCIAVVSKPEHGQGFACHTGQQWAQGSWSPAKVLTCESRGSRRCELLLYDVVPDGVSTVAIERLSGPPLSVPVRGNVYVATVGGGPASARRPTYVRYNRPHRGEVRQRIEF
jgi:hypothetical protein